MPNSQNKQGEQKPRVVCLCGSSKWPQLHHQIMMEETLAGRIVVPMGLYGHADYPPGAKAATNDGDESTEVKRMLDRLHFDKIDLSDEIVIVRVDGYMGSSTKRELEYAQLHSKAIRYYDAPSAALLSQQHAPSKEVEERIDELAAFFIDQYLPENFEAHSALCELLKSYRDELATELTKGREEDAKFHEQEIEKWNDRCAELVRDNDALRQQLAEANERVLLFEKLSVERGREIETIRAQNIALSAVVEKMKRGLESIVHECGINPAGVYYIIAHAATQLLADLGQSK